MIEKENRPWYQKGWDMASDFAVKLPVIMTKSWTRGLKRKST
ncbi:hypothetical protein [Metabacillus sp. RGM 3146]